MLLQTDFQLGVRARFLSLKEQQIYISETFGEQLLWASPKLEKEYLSWEEERVNESPSDTDFND